MNKKVIIWNEESKSFTVNDVVMTSQEQSEFIATRDETNRLEKLNQFRKVREKLLIKYDIYSMKVIRGQLQEDANVEQWYQDMLDFTSQITKDTIESDWPVTPNIIQNI